ncbi:MAG: hypothetical protein C4325_05350 [Blastocatellia bacterium]
MAFLRFGVSEVFICGRLALLAAKVHSRLADLNRNRRHRNLTRAYDAKQVKKFASAARNKRDAKSRDSP